MLRVVEDADYSVRIVLASNPVCFLRQVVAVPGSEIPFWVRFVVRDSVRSRMTDRQILPVAIESIT